MELLTYDSCVKTWGVEFEFVFGFHESELQNLLNYYAPNAARIVKNFTESEHDRIIDLYTGAEWAHGRNRWPCWALDVDPMSDQTCFLDSNLIWCHDLTEEMHCRRLRQYGIEHLLIAQQALLSQGLPTNVYGFLAPGLIEVKDTRNHVNFPNAWLTKECADFSKWTLTNDASFTGATKNELMAGLPYMIDERTKNDWDSYFVELTSRILSLDYIDRDCHEVGQYLQVIQNKHTQSLLNRGPRNWGAFDSVFAGTHIHIGLNWQSAEDINPLLIRHIAFLILTNEKLISQLHPYRRRGEGGRCSPVDPIFAASPANEDIAQQEAGMIAEEEICAAELKEKFVTQSNLDSNRSHFFRHNHKPHEDDQTKYQEVGEAIFHPFELLRTLSFVQDMTRYPTSDSEESLYRGYLVNFSNIEKMIKNKPNTKPTIEFRQHGCTLDSNEVRHWVKLLSALVKLAERKAIEAAPWGLYSTEGQREMAKYPGECISIEELCSPAMLNLGDRETSYWRSRVDQHADDETNFLQARTSRLHDRRQRKTRFGLAWDGQDYEDANAYYDSYTRPQLWQFVKSRGIVVRGNHYAPKERLLQALVTHDATHPTP